MGMEIIDFKATKCKHCYKCVRYCGVKAIQVKDEHAGQVYPVRSLSEDLSSVSKNP